MTLAPGTRIGPYEITATIGAGGMGEVYRALDSSLDRIVAIKILPELLASDAERVARFSREAKTLASLNHANIAHIHGIVESPFALVMEFVEGEDLAQRLARGPVPLDDAIPIAKQIADALECAHEQGVIHRDLKPANVKVRPDGTVKVLDFGLAKALSAPMESSSGSVAPILSPTFTTPAMTQMGIILGTAAYMAPEQARGKAVDRRADVWAFGVVLFEMLSGTRAFEGSEVSDTLAFVLTREPDWNALPADTPGPIRRLLRRCLHKDRKQRLADISDARLELDEALSPSAAERPGVAAPAPVSRWRQAAVPVALLLGMLLGGAAAWKIFAPVPRAEPVTRFTITLPDGIEFTNTGRHFIGISRDGSRVVYTAGSQLYVRHLDHLASEPVPGSALGSPVVNPIFSPDGQSIAFYSDLALRRIPVSGGTPFTLATEFANPLGMSWSEGAIFAGQTGVGIVRIPESGGKAEVVVKAGDGESLQTPQLLPDNETLIFTSYPMSGDLRYDKGRVVAYTLRTGQRKVLYEGGADGQVTPTGHLIFGNGSVLYAMRFNSATLTATGTPTPILEGVRRSPATGAAMYRIAANGTLVYVPGSAMSSVSPRTLGFLDRTGKIVPLNIPASTYDTPRLSPDGSRIAVVVTDDTKADIWIQDLPVRSVLRRLTFGGRNRFPTWSPDGKQLAFQSNRDGDDAVYVQDADVSGSAATLLVKPEPGASLAPSSWSIGQWLAVTAIKDTGLTVHVVSLAEKKLIRFVGPGVSSSAAAAFSPDGRWLAYMAGGGASGTMPMTFIEPFPSTGAQYQIGEGGQPVWSPPDGRELLINPRAPQLALYSIVTSPRVTFALTARLDRSQSFAPPQGARQYDFTPDGKQLLVVLPSSISTTPTRDINVVLNWLEELKKVL